MGVKRPEKIKIQEGTSMASKTSSRDQFRTIVRSDLQSFKPIADYGLIGDMRTCALVGIDGSVDWMCIPRFDSPSFFGAILDAKKGGNFRVCPEADRFQSMQTYEPLTNVLSTTFRVDASEAILTDFMPCFTIERTQISYGELHRRVECRDGKMELEVYLAPRLEYGAHIPDIQWIEGVAYNFSSRFDRSNQGSTLLTPTKLQEAEKGTLTGRFELSKGQKVDFILRNSLVGKNERFDPNTDIKLKETRDYWRNWVSRCELGGKWKEQVLRSALALKLLVYSPTGSIVAAPTTSLPEEIGGARNWDYRFSWIRDSSFVIWAFHSLGFNEEANSYLDWLLGAFSLTIGSLQPMIGITGYRELTERTIDSLSGYMNSSPVRVGNEASGQFQLDLYGIFVDALFFSHKHGRGVNRKVFDYLVLPIISTLEDMWRRPDNGIWEVRSQPEHFVYSKVWAWVAVDRALKIAEEHGFSEYIERWSLLREQIRDEILKKGYDESLHSFVRSYGSKSIDAANLLMPQVRFIPGNDPMMIGTVDATVNKLLTSNGFVYRYLDEDGLPGKEGAFLICSFWLVNCLTIAGRLNEAEKLMNSVAGYANHLGLFSEEVDPQSGGLLGNFPQAFTHMGFITAAVNLSKALDGTK
jgi:alpha,alpha-trehalase